MQQRIHSHRHWWGITDDIQIKDIYCHHNLKSKYPEYEQLMLKQLEENPINIPSSSRDEDVSLNTDNLGRHFHVRTNP